MHLRTLFSRFRSDHRAVAVVEFALILPVLITLYFGTIEAATIYSADRRVSVIAGTIGDLVAQVKSSIASATLTDYFQASQGIMQPYSTTNLTQVVTVLSVSSAGTATVYWSRAYNGGTARTANSTVSLTNVPQMKALALGSYLVMSEVKYPYRPIFGMVISATVNLNHTEYFLPRFGAKIDIS